MLVLLFCTRMFFHLFLMLCFSWNINIACFMEHQTQSLGTQFSFKNWYFFYSCRDLGVRSNSLLENAYLLKGYFAEFANVFMCLKIYFFAITKDSIIQNLFQKLSIFKTECSSPKFWDCQWHKTFSVTPVFTALILFHLFQIIKICQCCGFTFTIFSFFLQPPMPLQLAE